MRLPSPPWAPSAPPQGAPHARLSLARRRISGLGFAGWGLGVGCAEKALKQLRGVFGYCVYKGWQGWALMGRVAGLNSKDLQLIFQNV